MIIIFSIIITLRHVNNPARTIRVLMHPNKIAGRFISATLSVFPGCRQALAYSVRPDFIRMRRKSIRTECQVLSSCIARLYTQAIGNRYDRSVPATIRHRARSNLHEMEPPVVRNTMSRSVRIVPLPESGVKLPA